MTSKSPMRSCEDVDESVLSYAEIKALCAGNPLIKEKMDLDIEVSRLKVLKSDYQSQKHRLEDVLIKVYPYNIQKARNNIQNMQSDIEMIKKESHKIEGGISPMTIGNKAYSDKGEAGKALLEVCAAIQGSDETKIGHYHGFDMYISYKFFECRLTLKGAGSYTTALGDDTFGNFARINNTLSHIPELLEKEKTLLENIHQQTESAKMELEKPFEFEIELTKKTERLVWLDAELDTESRQADAIEEESEEELPELELQSAKSEAKNESISAKKKPSILEMLKQKNDTRATANVKEKSEKQTIANPYSKEER